MSPPCPGEMVVLPMSPMAEANTPHVAAHDLAASLPVVEADAKWWSPGVAGIGAAKFPVRCWT